MEKSHSNGSNTPLKISRRKEILDSKILPNPDDPNYYCASCQKNFSSRSTYRSHIGIFQLNVGLNLRKLSVCALRKEMDAGDRKNKRSTICEKDFSSRCAYIKHTNVSHKDPTIKPLWNDRLNYCRSCKRTYSHEWVYWSHIKKVHNNVCIRKTTKETAPINSNPTQ